jgi:branched-chain amino acid aminotransferase
MPWYSQTWTFLDGRWQEGNPAIMGPRTHAAWQASSVFDGARIFDNVMPDMDKHAARVNQSAIKMGLKPLMQPDEIVALARQGAAKFKRGTAIYVKPMYWAEADGMYTIVPDPDSTRFCLCLFEAPMPEPQGSSLTVSSFRRPSLETMPTDVKTGALYPNNARAAREAAAKGFGNALVLDMLGNVAETAFSNVWMVKDGVAMTPAANGTFLNGVTRQRVIDLLGKGGVEVRETTLRVADFLAADEVFTTGNYSKVMPVVKVENVEMQPGPVYRKARELYWAYAKSGAFDI